MRSEVLRPQPLLLDPHLGSEVWEEHSWASPEYGGVLLPAFPYPSLSFLGKDFQKRAQLPVLAVLSFGQVILSSV